MTEISGVSIDDFLEAVDPVALSAVVSPVLVVDDSPTMRRVLRDILAGLGIRDVNDAGTAREAFALLHQRQFRLVICDIEMQEISGIQLLQAIRSDVRIPKVPVLMVTGSLDTKHVATLRHVRADGYLLKPFSGESLRRKILEVVERCPPAPVDEEAEASQTRPGLVPMHRKRR